jgi:hypothetical protein
MAPSSARAFELSTALSYDSDTHKMFQSSLLPVSWRTYQGVAIVRAVERFARAVVKEREGAKRIVWEKSEWVAGRICIRLEAGDGVEKRAEGPALGEW